MIDSTSQSHTLTLSYHLLILAAVSLPYLLATILYLLYLLILPDQERVKLRDVRRFSDEFFTEWHTPGQVSRIPFSQWKQKQQNL